MSESRLREAAALLREQPAPSERWKSVTLAFAEWLDAEAHHDDRWQKAKREITEPVLVFDGSTMAEALTVADAILAATSEFYCEICGSLTHDPTGHGGGR